MPTSLESFTEMVLSLRKRVNLGSQQLYRLVGVGLTHFQIDMVEAGAQEQVESDSSLLILERAN